MKKKNVLSLLIFLFSCSFAASAQDAESFFNEGKRLKDEKKSAEALKMFQKAVISRANYPEAIYETGWCQNDLKMYTEALVTLRKAANLWPDVARVHFELGYANEKLSLHDSALAHYRRVLEISPAYYSAYRRMGEVYYNTEQYDKGIEQFEKYESLCTSPITDYLFWYRKGFMYNNLKQYGKAKEALLKSEAQKKDYTNTYLELGYASGRLKLNDEAIDYYKKAMALDPKSYIPYNGIGEVYRDNIKDLPTSMSWYQKALDINPNERKAHFGMGYCLNSQGKYDEAIPHLKQAIAGDATYTAAYVELGYSNFKTGHSDDALKNFEKALQLSPKNENARYYSGLVYIDKKDRTKAQKMVDELKELSSKNAGSLQELVNKM